MGAAEAMGQWGNGAAEAMGQPGCSHLPCSGAVRPLQQLARLLAFSLRVCSLPAEALWQGGPAGTRSLLRLESSLSFPAPQARPLAPSGKENARSSFFVAARMTLIYLIEIQQKREALHKEMKRISW